MSVAAQTRKTIETRLRALDRDIKPLLAEREQLTHVLASFDAAARPPRANAKRGRPTGSATGSRAIEALRLVSEQPGITVSDLAEAMDIGTTYLYRVMPRLERDGKVRKSGTGYWPAELGESSSPAGGPS